jgi:hypothetical protein
MDPPKPDNENGADSSAAGSPQDRDEARSGSEAGRSADGCESDGWHRRERVGRRAQARARKERVLHTRISEQLSDDIRRLAEDLRVPTSNLVRNVLEEVFAVVESVSDDVGDLFEDVLEEAEFARDRIRRRSRHRRQRSRRSTSPQGHRSWGEAAEAEIRSDEAEEAAEGGRGAPGAVAGAPPAGRPEFPEVIGWQPLVLNQAQECADCRRSLRRGARGFVGLTEAGLSRTTLCRDCLQDR